MKKAILTIGLFTIVTALTSFATPTTTILENTIVSDIDGTGGQDNGGKKKIDFVSTNKISTAKNYNIQGSQDLGKVKKID
jgi:hypothetical protein